MSKLFRNSVSFFVIVAIAAVALSAQVRPPVPRPSSKSIVTQTIGTTDISIAYSRPAVKGRVIYGDWPTAVAGEATLDNQNARPAGAPIVPYGHIWRAGANEATLITFADDVIVNGQPLPAGKYSFHAIPAKDAEWTLIFNKDDGQWGSFTYDAKKDAIRVKTKPQWAADSREFLAYDFENVGDKSATVVLAWEKARVPFTVEVKDVVGSTMARLKAYVGDAKPDEWQRPFNAANYAKASKLTDDATKWYDQAVKGIDLQIAAKPTFANYRSKATILLNAGRGADAIVAAEKAVEVGKAEKADAAQVTALEKRIVDLKAGKQ